MVSGGGGGAMQLIRSARLAELAREDERHAEAEALARVGRQEGGEQRED